MKRVFSVFIIIFSEKGEIREEKIMEFGYNRILGQEYTALLVLRNKSAIETGFHIQAKVFHPDRVPTPPAKEKGTSMFS